MSGTKATALCWVFFFLICLPTAVVLLQHKRRRQRERDGEKTAVLFIVVPFVFHQRFAGAQGHGEAGVDIPAGEGGVTAPDSSPGFVAGPLWSWRNTCALTLTPTHNSASQRVA